MATNKKKTTPPKSGTTEQASKPMTCARCPVRNQQQKLICALVKKLGTKLRGKDAKATVGDYIRLLQLQKEMEEEQPREIQVRWVEPEPECEN
jgi:hypothetical protein